MALALVMDSLHYHLYSAVEEILEVMDRDIDEHEKKTLESAIIARVVADHAKLKTETCQEQEEGDIRKRDVKSALAAGVQNWEIFPWAYVDTQNDSHRKAEYLNSQYFNKYIDTDTYIVRLEHLFKQKFMSQEEYTHSMHHLYSTGGIDIYTYFKYTDDAFLVYCDASFQQSQHLALREPFGPPRSQ